MHYKRKGDRVDDVLHNIVLDHVNRLEHENKRLREALEFYADADWYHLKQNDEIIILRDAGKEARQALAGEQHEPSTD